MTLLVRITVACVLVLCYSPAIPAQQEVLDVEATSLLESVALNAHAMRSYDVLIRMEVVDDVSDEDFTRTEFYSRLRFDWDRSRFLCAQSVETRSLVGSSKPLKRFRRGWRSVDAVVKGLSRSGMQKVSQEAPEHMLRSGKHLFRGGNCPDVRLVGLFEFPRFLGSESQIFEKFLASVSGDFRLRKSDGAAIRVVSRTPIQSKAGNPKAFYEQTWELSRSNMMPKELNSRLVLPEIGASSHRARETYEWKDTGGVFLPVLVTGEHSDVKRLASKDGSVRHLKYVQTRTAQFHWFSINEQLPEDYFGENLLENPNEFVKLVDPTLSNAKSITLGN